MNILHITNLSNNKSSGLSNIVPLHIKWQAKQNNVCWYNINSKYIPSNELNCILVNRKYKKKGIITSFPKPFCKPDLVVFHGIFFYHYYQVAQELKALNIKYIVVPHGSLTKFSINKKKIKKKIAFKIFFNSFLKNANAIQYLTEGEYRVSGEVWNSNHIIIPNGIDLPLQHKEKFCERSIKGVYIGRKSIYYKGLDLLLGACSSIKEEMIKNECYINIYGPEEDRANEKLKRIIEKNHLEKVINIFDSVYDKEKEEILLNGDFFVLTSRTEGHPVSVIEALSYGIPCLLSEETNMAKEIVDYKAGWIAKTSVESIANSLLELIQDKATFQDLGANAQILARNYEWSQIAKESLEKYQMLIENK